MARAFKVSTALLSDFRKIYNRREQMSPADQATVEGICTFANEKQIVTYRQLQVMGYISKRYLQDDEYIHHNWKIWLGQGRAAA